MFVDYDCLVTGEMTAIRENGAITGPGVLATFAYDDLGRRTGLIRGNGTVTSYGYDPVSRLASWAENLAGTANDQTTSFSYNPASQIAGLTRSNDAYAWTGHGSGSTASVANGLNQLSQVGGAAVSHDPRGNLTTDPTSGKTYGYSSENLLTSSSGGTAASLTYDPAMRLYQVAGAVTARFAYDGVNVLAEYDGANALTRRYVWGPGVDELLVQYTGAGTATREWLHADERGSVVAISDGSGAATQLNRYDEYGKPQSTNVGRFQYTGQMGLPELGLYHYKARAYAPQLGRFLQTDPAGGSNLYAYVGNDPIGLTDPSGMIASRCGMTLEGDDLSRCTDFTPQGVGWGQHSYDWSGSVAVHVSGRIGAKDYELDLRWSLFGDAAYQCAANQRCGGASRDANRQKSDTLRAILNDRDVFRQMKSAWRMSFGHSGREEVHEHGFWIRQVGRDYIALGIQESFLDNPRRILLGPSWGANIWFHTHPFTDSWGGLSRPDRYISWSRSIMTIAYSHNGWFEIDYRRRR